MCTRSASVVALQPCEAFVVTRYELNRFLGSCPELRQRLLDLGRSYPSDQELLTAWRHDQAWADYRSQLLSEVRRSAPPEGVHGITSLPAFQPPRSISPPTRLDEASDLYKWADEYLDAHVLDSMEDLFFDEAEQPEAVQGGRAPG